MTSTKSNISSFHHPALDGVRGLAILLVLIHHLLRASPPAGHRIFDILFAVQYATWTGVDLFFALSGFLITGILYDSRDSRGFFKNFYARRFLRIFPLYYGFLFVLLLLTVPLHLEWHGMQWILLLYLQNTGLVVPFFHYSPSPFINLNHFWSLAVEEQFYLVWPFIVFWIRGLGRLIIVTLALSIAALVLRIVLLEHDVSGVFVYCFTACRADSLLIGGCLALLMRSPWRNRAIQLARPVFLIASSLLVAIAIRAGGFVWKDGKTIGTVGYSLLAIAGASLIADCFRKGSSIRSFFDTRILRFLGKYSYGIYVFHYSLDASLTGVLRPALRNLTHSALLSVIGAALVVAMSTIVLAVLSFQLYEKRFLSLKKYFVENSAVADAPVQLSSN